MELAARAESLKSAEALPVAEAQQLALEAMQLYAPMAHALKASSLARRLEDDAFQVSPQSTAYHSLFTKHSARPRQPHAL